MRAFITVLLSFAALTLAALDTMPVGEIFPEPQKIIGDYREIAHPQMTTVRFYGIDHDKFQEMFSGALHHAVMKMAETEAEVSAGTEMTIHAGLISDPDIQKMLGECAQTELPAQGYIIKPLESDESDVNVVIAGADLRGLFYGACSLAQLKYVKDGKAMQRLVGVVDYPVWENRMAPDYLPNFFLDGMKIAAYNKFSGSALMVITNWRNPDWWTRMEPILNDIKYMSETGVHDFMVIIHMYQGGWFTSEGKMNMTDEAQIQEYINACRRFADYGINHIMFAADDTTKRGVHTYEFYFEEEKERFNSVGEAHGYLTRRVYDAMREDYPNMKYSMVPAPYSFKHGIGHPGIDLYIADWAKAAPECVAWVWTGPGVFSPEVTREPADRLRALLLNKHKIYLWDNSNGILAPMPRWNTRLYPTMHEDDESMIFHLGLFYASRIWEQPYFFTVNDFLWNPENYCADRAYARANALIFGEENVPLVLEVREKLAAMMAALNNNDHKAIAAPLAEFEAVVAKLGEVTTRDGDKFDLTQLNNMINAGRVFRDHTKKHLYVNPLPEIMLDGVISPEEWDNAEVIELVTRSGNKEAATTKMYIGYNAGNLYVAFDAPLSRPLPPLDKMVFDGACYNSPDNIHLYIQTAGETIIGKPLIDYAGEYSQLIFDYAGNRFDSHSDGGHQSWDGEWQMATKVYDDRWTSEMRFHPTDLDEFTPIMPAPGVKWRGNFHRNYIDGNLVQSWDTAGWTFHQASYFGVLEFK